MPKRVLDVGQCQPDHHAIAGFLQEHFDVQVDRAHNAAETFDLLRRAEYDLVLINRKLDQDYSEGVVILKAIKADREFAGVPVMLVTNYSEHQAAAVAAGGEPGFGKSELHHPETAERLAAFLASSGGVGSKSPL